LPWSCVSNGFHIQSDLIPALPPNAQESLRTAEFQGGVIRDPSSVLGERKSADLSEDFFDPGLQGLAGNRRYFNLNGSLGLVLHDDGTRGDLVAMSDVSDLEGEKVAATKLAVNTEIKVD
jgi:hypothetical protein